MSFLAELKRRKVIKVTLAYVVGAWLVLQLADVLSELLDLPDVVGRVVVAVAALGLPVAIFLSWAYELTAEGLKRDSEVAPEARSSGKLINAVVIGLLAAALGYFVWESRFRDASTEQAAEAKVDGPAVAGGDVAEPDGIGRSVAVLPFENFSGDPQDEYFADGLADTLLHKLAQIDDLKVIARNSSFQFKGTNQDVREIGEILGVGTLLEGSVQRAGEQVRIIAQLVRTSDGAHVWSQTFDDRNDNIFALQDRVAAAIVDAFQISLSAAERERLMRNGTNDPAAYDLLIKALNQPRTVDEMTDMAPEDDQRIVLLQQAVERDPDYAAAWAYLARAWNGLAFATDSASDWERYMHESQAAAERAIELDPALPLAHNALGWVAHRKGERLEAERHFRRALELDPNETGAMSGLALQIGWTQPEAALELLERVAEIDPTSPFTHRQRQFFLRGQGRIDEAIAALERAIELEPDEGLFYRDIGAIRRGQGRIDEAAQVITRLLRRSPNSFEGQHAMGRTWLAAAGFERAAEWTDVLLRERPDSDEGKLLVADTLLGAGEFEAALDQLAEVTDNVETGWQLRARGATACLALSRNECASQETANYLSLLQERNVRGDGIPEFDAYASVLNLVVQERSGQRAATPEDWNELLATFDDSHFFRAGAPFLRAGLLARAGRRDEAIDVLESIVSDPDGAVYNIDVFGLAPANSFLLDPFRGKDGFDNWMVRYQSRRDAMLSRMLRLEARGEIIRPAAVITGVGA